MAKFRARPIIVEAFKHTDHRAPVPPEFASIEGLTTGGKTKITKDPVGQLLVPVAGAFRTCRIGDYVVLMEDGSLDVSRADLFEANFEPIDAPVEVEKEGDAAEAPAAT